MVSELEPQNIICLYSIYSEQCKQFLSKIQENTIDFINMLQIDTPYSRKIVSDKIKKVPSVLIEFSNGLLEIYEGEKAFTWLNEVINNKKLDEIKEKTFLEQQKIQNELLELKRQKELLELQKKELENTNNNPKQETINNKTENKPEKNKYTAIDDVMDSNLLDLESTDMERDVMERDSAKMSASTKKTQDLLSRARELEKGRDDLSSKKPPPL